jgi:hypothetical protein
MPHRKSVALDGEQQFQLRAGHWAYIYLPAVVAFSCLGSWLWIGIGLVLYIVSLMVLRRGHLDALSLTVRIGRSWKCKVAFSVIALLSVVLVRSGGIAPLMAYLAALLLQTEEQRTQNRR